MPLISPIGRKALPIRVLIAAIYFVLIAGGITMVYPLILMLSGSVKGIMDADEIDMVPRFLRNETAFFQRYLESKYGNRLHLLNNTWGTEHLDWRKITKPPAASPRQLEDFAEFRRVTRLPDAWTALGHIAIPGRNLREFRRKILQDSGGDLVRAGQMLDVTLRGWLEVFPVNHIAARGLERPGRALDLTDQFKGRCAPEDLILMDLESLWRVGTIFPKYREGLAQYRKQVDPRLRDWSELHLPAQAPSRGAFRADWEAFVRQKVPLAFLKVNESVAPAYRAWLRDLHGSDLVRLNKSYATTYRSFDEVSVSPTQSFTGSAWVDYNRFLREKMPLGALSLDAPTFRYREFLRAKFHGDLAALRAAYGVDWGSFDDASLPTAAMDWRDFQAQKSAFRWELLVRNYDYVVDLLARQGRGFQNTFILIVLCLVTQLTITPLAAYALSRFGLPTTYKILLFCMGTVAFPGEVMMIPSFLQLKELHLLNTFWALVLPGVANGFNIFLMKGFFDSLPKELYDAATIDGAGEITIFWQVTMALSKPILAVMALGAFMGAFGAFFFALIICPDEKMWTLMVWLFQIQSTSGSIGINYAALCLSSIPTLLVFIFCQNIILRGIVVPTEK